MKIIQLLLLLFTLSLSQSSAQDPLACNAELYVSLDLFGEAEITLDMVLEGSPPSGYDSIWVTPGMITCEDMDTTHYFVYGLTPEGDTNACWGVLNIADMASPQVVVEGDITVSFNNSTTIPITLEMIDDGTWDNCDLDYMTVTPNVLDCSSPDSNVIVLTAYDASGNSSEGWVNVFIEQVESGPIECNDFSFVHIGSGDVTLTLSDLLATGNSACMGNYTYTILPVDGGPVVVDGLIGMPHLNYNYEVTVTDNINSESCSFEFTVINGFAPYNICVYNTGGTPIPGVELATGAITDDAGCATIDALPGMSITPTKDGPQLDGVDVVDIALLREAVLSQSTLEPGQLIAGNIENLGVISSLDLVYIAKAIEGTYEFDPNWKFVDADFPLSEDGNASNLPGSIVFGNQSDIEIRAFKLGDVDMSYDMLVDDEDKSFLNVKDISLNAGESYTIPLYYDTNTSISGVQLNIPFETDEYLITAISSSLPNYSFDEEIHLQNNIAQLFWYHEEIDGIAFEANEPIFEISIQAKQNGILHHTFDLVQDLPNKHMNETTSQGESLKIYIEDFITLPVWDIQDSHQISLYPNPSQGVIHIDVIGSDFHPTDVQIMSVHGKILNHMPFSNSIELKDMQAGLYIIQLSNQEGQVYQQLISFQ